MEKNINNNEIELQMLITLQEGMIAESNFKKLARPSAMMAIDNNDYEFLSDMEQLASAP
jgi:hypothetical protein